MNFRLLKSFDNNLIWCDVSTRHIRPYITEKNRKQVFLTSHGSGHPSHRATKPLINTRFVWIGINIDIAKWCRSCMVARPPIYLAIISQFSYADGFRYLLTCVDRFTRWPEAIPLVDIRAEMIADALFSGWIARFGTPATITTDRGAQFESKLWDGLCNQFGIVRNRNTSYHPLSNGMVERFHRQLNAAIMAHESPNP